jgi:transposase
MRRAPQILLSDSERKVLTQWARGRRTPARLVLRAKILLLASEGYENAEIAATLETSAPTVGLWRARFATERIKGIESDAPRGGRPARLDLDRQIIDKTTQSKPATATHWTTRTLAKELGTTQSRVARVWRAHGLKPHLVRTFKVSSDPHFFEKLHDVVGLYLNPPERAIVLSADEKSQIQALDRTQPGLPLKPGRCGTRTHDYKRFGTTTLFAAIDTLEGKIIHQYRPRHRHQEWVSFLRKIDREVPKDLQIHMIVDNLATHKHRIVRAWLEKHPRFKMHFTPTSSSWLNIVERLFSELTMKNIRRGSFTSVEQLQEAIDRAIADRNDKPRPFAWTASAEDILKKVQRAREALNKEQNDSLH